VLNASNLINNIYNCFNGPFHMHKPIFLDTSLLTAAFGSNVDIEAELRRLDHFGALMVLQGTFDELEKLASSNSVQGRHATTALNWLKTKDIEVKPDLSGHVDDDIVAYASENACIVATQDKDLKKRLRKLHITVVALRQRSHLA